MLMFCRHLLFRHYNITKKEFYHGIITVNNFDLYKGMQKMFKEGMSRVNQHYDNKFELNYINTI